LTLAATSTSEFVTDMTQDGDTLYATISFRDGVSAARGTLSSFRKSGGNRVDVFHDSTLVWGVTVSDQYVYFADGNRTGITDQYSFGNVMRCPKASSCASATQIFDGLLAPNERVPLAVSGSFVLWTEAASGNDQECVAGTGLCGLPSGLGSVNWGTPFKKTPGLLRPSRSAMVGSQLLYASMGDSAGVKTCTFPECTDSHPFTTGFAATLGVGDIETTDQAIYFVEYLSVGGGGKHRMWRCNHSGTSCTQTLAQSLAGFGRYAAIGDDVYWANSSGIVRHYGENLEPLPFASDVASFVLVDEKAVYWLSNNKLFKRARD